MAYSEEHKAFVSIIVPAYNQAHFLEDAISSILSQTYPHYEIIIVNDGSTDNTDEIAQKYFHLHNFRYLTQDNLGLAGARNTGIRAAQGELIGLLDADDQWKPNYLETMVTLAAQYPNGSVYYCQAQGMTADGRDLPQRFGGPVIPSEKIYSVLLRANFLIPSTILMRRAAIEGAGLFDQSLRSCEDWDLWLRILPRHVFIGTSSVRVRYRIHSSSLSTNLDGMWRAARTVIEKNFGHDGELWGAADWKKRRAYGGLYRYSALTTIQKLNDWQSCARYLGLALQADPTLAVDLDLFYDLALGTQPPGYRDSLEKIEFEENAKQILNLLENVFCSPLSNEILLSRRNVYGTAYYAMGLIAYKTGHESLCRRFLTSAIYYRPSLLLERRITEDFLKSFVGRQFIERVKNIRQNPAHHGGKG